MYGAGLKTSERLRLRVGDLDFFQHMVRIHADRRGSAVFRAGIASVSTQQAVADFAAQPAGLADGHFEFVVRGSWIFHQGL